MAIRRPLLSVVLVGIAIWFASGYLWANQEYVVEYPHGYRTWLHLTSYVIGAQNPAFERNGGLHVFYANDKAREGLQKGKFPDGSVLIDERNAAVEKDGITRVGEFRGIAVMSKDARRYADTGGWGFEVFTAADLSKGILTVQARAACQSCHSKQIKRDFVFSELRP